MPVPLTPITALETLKDDFIAFGITPLLGCIQRLEVFDEKAHVRSTTRVDLAYRNLLSSFVPEVIKNREIQASGFLVDYDDGQISFASAIDTTDDVLVTYRFKYFTNDDLGRFLDLALSMINNRKPQTAFTFEDESIPATWFSMLSQIAYAHAMETLLKDLLAWKAYLIFREPMQVAQYIGQSISRIWAMWETEAKSLKRRGLVQPRAAASGRWKFPRAVTGSNFQQFTVIRG